VGTPAALFEDQIPEEIKEDRHAILMQTQNAVVEEQNEKKLGKIYTVLTEGYDPMQKIFYGRRAADAPDIDAKVYFTSDTPIAEGEFVEVIIHEALEYDLVGEVVTDSEE